MNVLRTENLKKYYGDDDNLVRALDGVDLEVERGEFVAVVGTSGSGKSTLLHMLGGLDRPTEGRVFVDGKDISELKDDALCVFRRRKIGFVFQSYNLVPVLNVYENIVLPIELDGNTVDKNYVRKVIEILGLTDRVHRLPSQLSGGQQQRVAIARALSAKPAILLADEPTGNLDSKSCKAVIDAFLQAKKEMGATIFMVTHDSFAASFCDRVVVLKDGRIYGELTRSGTRREFMDELLDTIRTLSDESIPIGRNADGRNKNGATPTGRNKNGATFAGRNKNGATSTGGKADGVMSTGRNTDGMRSSGHVKGGDSDDNE